jgi:hypothetical protein
MIRRCLSNKKNENDWTPVDNKQAFYDKVLEKQKKEFELNLNKMKKQQVESEKLIVELREKLDKEK